MWYCGTLAPRELVHDETYDTPASKRLKQGTSNVLAIRRLLRETYDSLALRRVGLRCKHGNPSLK